MAWLAETFNYYAISLEINRGSKSGQEQPQVQEGNGKLINIIGKILTLLQFRLVSILNTKCFLFAE